MYRGGGYSMILAEMSLLKEAVQYDLDYFHLISGADLPIKKWENIDEFFKTNNGFQFVSFVPQEFQVSMQKRVKYFWLFQEIIGNPRIVIKRKRIGRFFLLVVQRCFVQLQKLIHIDRRDKNIKFKMGSNWFSITKDFAQYIVQKEKWIRKTFKCTLCGDEAFVSTLLENSKFANMTLPNQRYVDWNRGNPYIFRIDDLNELLSCNQIFARKFDQKIDESVIDAVYTYIKK